MTMIDSIREMQTRNLEGVKTVQEQFISYNERIAGTMLGAMPDVQSPFAAYMPKPTEVVEAYYAYMGELYEANKEFASRLVSAWERPDEADASN